MGIYVAFQAASKSNATIAFEKHSNNIYCKYKFIKKITLKTISFTLFTWTFYFHPNNVIIWAMKFSKFQSQFLFFEVFAIILMLLCPIASQAFEPKNYQPNFSYDFQFPTIAEPGSNATLAPSSPFNPINSVQIEQRLLVGHGINYA